MHERTNIILGVVIILHVCLMDVHNMKVYTMSHDVYNHAASFTCVSTNEYMHAGDKRVWCLILLVSLITIVTCWYWPVISYKIYLHHSSTVPFLSKDFFGRKSEIKTLKTQVDFYNHSTRIFNIYGPPGFGKSTLAIHAGHAAIRDGVEVHYVNMGEFPDKDVKQILAKKVLKKEKKTDFEHLLEWLRDYRFWYYHVLFIFDNCDDVLHKQKDEFLDAVTKVVESSLSVRVLITSREVVSYPEYFHWHKVDELSSAAAIELLGRKVKKLTLSERKQIAELTGNVPLALQIVSSLLNVPNSPSATQVIHKLNKDVIPFLSPEHFPASKQLQLSISLSIGYLSRKLFLGSVYLVEFPGSFDEQAATAVLQTLLEHPNDAVDILNSLVRSSLLEVNERTSRYQYHRLIRQYFLHLTLSMSRLSLSTQISAYIYYFYYAQKLICASHQFSYDHHGALAIFYSEQHNFQRLLSNLQTPHLVLGDHFLLSAVAVSSAIRTGLFRLRFSTDDWCAPLGSALLQLDQSVLDLKFYFIHKHSHGLDYSTFLNYYTLMISQFASCQEMSDGIAGAIKVYTHRTNIIEVNILNMRSEDYIGYYEALASYHSRLGQQNDSMECHQKIVSRGNDILVSCNPEVCNNQTIGYLYYKMGKFDNAAKFLEKALQEDQTTLERSRMLVELFFSYANLQDNNNRLLALEKLAELHNHISNSELYHCDYTHLIITIFRNNGYEKEADILEERLLKVVLEIRVQPQQGSVSLDKAFHFAEHLFDSKNYLGVVDVGAYILDSLDLQNPDDMYLKLKMELLIGKAKFLSGNYSLGMDAIETVLLEIINHQESEYIKEKESACWYLVPRIKYINVCYDVRNKVETIILGAIYLVLHSPLSYPQSSSDHLNQDSFYAEHGSDSSSDSSDAIVEYSTSREVATEGMGSIVLVSVDSIEDVLIIISNTLRANIQVNFDDVYEIKAIIDYILAITIYPLIQIPFVCFIINVGCVWIKLWILYVFMLFVKHPILYTIFVFYLFLITLTGQLKEFIRILRDPRLHAAQLNVD